VSEAIIYEGQPLPLGRQWLITARAQVTTQTVPAPRILLRVARQQDVEAAVTAQVQEGSAFTIEVEFHDPVVPAWDEAMHPSMRRKLEEQRTVRSTYLQTTRAHVVEQGLDVRVDSGLDPDLGWVLPSPPPGVAFMGLLAHFAGWHVLVVAGTPRVFELQAPAWWGYTDHSPEQAAPGQAQPPDGTLTVSVTLRAA